MAPFSYLLVLLASIVYAAAAVSDPSTSGFLQMQVVHSTNAKYFGKRAVELSLAVRSDVAYYAKLNFGTPAQPQFVQLDTGSFELWVNPSCNTLSSSDAAFCAAVGSFNTSASSTFESLNTGKELVYGIGSANITYVRDTVGLPGTGSAMQQVQFGVATSTTDEFSGILGIGYGEGLTTRYANFIDELAAQNVTRVKAFSLALGSKDEQEGVVVFGGVDTRKFAGSLARLPILPAASSPDGVPRYWINMTAVSSTASGGTAYPNSSVPVFLDSGSTLSLLPADLAASIAADFGASSASSSGYFTVDCSLASRNDTLDFSFDGVTVRVPYKEMIRQSGTQCMLGIQANSQFSLLGDTFMRSAYVVIDQTDNDIWMAQYVNCGSSPAALANAQSLEGLTGSCISQDSTTNSTADSSDSSSDSSASTSSATPSTSTVTSSATSSATSSVTSSATSSATLSATSSASSQTSTASSSSMAAVTLPSTASLLAITLLTALLTAALPSVFS